MNDWRGIITTSEFSHTNIQLHHSFQYETTYPLLMSFLTIVFPLVSRVILELSDVLWTDLKTMHMSYSDALSSVNSFTILNIAFQNK